jgi:hypothetical protein
VITKEDPTPSVLVNNVDKYMAELVIVEHATLLAVIVVTVIAEPVNVDPTNPVVRSVAVDRLDTAIREDTAVVFPVSVEYVMASALLIT